VNVDPYSDAVRSLFADTRHAGELEGRYGESVQGEASESEGGARVVLSAGIDGAIVRELRYRIFGCPVLVAAAEWTCRRYEGRPWADLHEFRAADCRQALDVPVEKTGRLLLMEDAIMRLLKALEKTP